MKNFAAEGRILRFWAFWILAYLGILGTADLAHLKNAIHNAHYDADATFLQVAASQRTSPPNPDVAPSDPGLTSYDEQHLMTHVRLLDADARGADWREIARVVLHLDPEHESDRVWRAFESHLSRAKWMTAHGYRHLLRGSASA